uniref:Ras and Rab interactor 1 n=1 Tax=Chrysemys picta bellii TaxID=8478 RepID=A0A8C3IDA8_CHRPI
MHCPPREVLPVTLRLPQPIQQAVSHKELEAISHLGLEFWSSSLNDAAPAAGQLGAIPTRSPRELDCGLGNGALGFLNPLFQGRDGGSRRDDFKRSIKVRVSTETSSPLSPPPKPPPPIPSSQTGMLPTPRREPGQYTSLSMSGYRVPQRAGEPLNPKPAGSSLPSLQELDSGSPSGSESEGGGGPRAPSPPAQRRPRAPLRSMSDAVLAVLAPEKQLARAVEGLARDRSTRLGASIQDFLTLVRGGGGEWRSRRGMRSSGLELGRERNQDTWVLLPRAQRKLLQLLHAYSPSTQVTLLLQACKGVYRAMGAAPDGSYGADEFLPVLSFILAQCDLPQLLMEAEYMMELMDPSQLLGEGGYYLTTLQASLALLGRFHEEEPMELRPDVQRALSWRHQSPSGRPPGSPCQVRGEVLWGESLTGTPCYPPSPCPLPSLLSTQLPTPPDPSPVYSPLHPYPLPYPSPLPAQSPHHPSRLLSPYPPCHPICLSAHSVPAPIPIDPCHS